MITQCLSLVTLLILIDYTHACRPMFNISLYLINSLTVIDFCLTKNIQTDRDTNMTCLKMNWASKANCKQRMGRAGRVSNGRVYRLVHKAFFMNHMQDYGVPEMKRCPLSQLVSQQCATAAVS